MFISNTKRCDDIQNIVAVERHSPHDYIANWFKEGNFLNSIAQLVVNLPVTSNVSGQLYQGQSQINIHSMVSYVDNNNDDGLSKYDYCCSNTDPDFGLYQLLMSIAYSGCDENKLAYHACKHEQKIFNNAIMAISNNLSCAFDTTCPCAICGKTGQTFDNCEEL